MLPVDRPLSAHPVFVQDQFLSLSAAQPSNGRHLHFVPMPPRANLCCLYSVKDVKGALPASAVQSWPGLGCWTAVTQRATWGAVFLLLLLKRLKEGWLCCWPSACVSLRLGASS